MTDTSSHNKKFDLLIASAVTVLVFAILLTILSGDRAGVAVTTMQPQGTAHSTTSVHITFAEPMDTTSVESYFTIDPPVEGAIRWVETENTSQFIFEPDTAFQSNRSYTVTVAAGAMSKNNRAVASDIRWSFNILPLRVAYLAPATVERDVPNLYMVDPGSPFNQTQLTFSSTGLLPDYAVSPDGTRIAFAEKDDKGMADLYLLNLDTNEIQQITQCIDARCEAPSWSPNGLRLVYQRTELNTNLPDIDRGVPRAWIVTLADLSTTPLLSLSQMLGKQPIWSPAGDAIAVYDQGVNGIVVYDLKSGSSKVIPSIQGETGMFDPTGTRLLFLDVLEAPGRFITTLSVANLANPDAGIKPILDGSTPVEDRLAAWHPDAKHIAVTRRYLDERLTQNAQVYMVNVETNQAEPLIVDDRYNNGAISWSPVGDALLMQRYPSFGEEPEPGIWVYDMETKTLRHVARNGYLPQWLP